MVAKARARLRSLKNRQPYKEEKIKEDGAQGPGKNRKDKGGRGPGARQEQKKQRRMEPRGSVKKKIKEKKRNKGGWSPGAR